MKPEIKEKLEVAESAFKSWKKIPFEKRQSLLRNLASLLNKRAGEYGKIITKEMQKPISQAVAEVEKCALMTSFYAEAEAILNPEIIKSEFSISEIHYVPKGVILGIMPWNFPFWQVLRFAVPTILAGNTVVLKHASICYGSGNAIQQLFSDAGFPDGVFQNLEIGHSQVKEVLEHPVVQAVSLTGSEKAGAEVASIAGRNIKKSLLELGGSDAFIVLDDADLDEAAEVGALARLQNCGQTCVAAKRFIVQTNIKDQFLPKFVAAYQGFLPNDPMDKNTKISGMARPDLAEDLLKQYEKAISDGAEIILPLERISETVFKPGLLAVSPGNPILQEEIFGPLGLILFAENDAEIAGLANDIPFGLSNSVWTGNKKRQQFFIEELESGTVNINRMTSSDPRFPFGGTKTSGYGTELSLLTLKEFVTPKTVLAK